MDGGMNFLGGRTQNDYTDRPTNRQTVSQSDRQTDRQPARSRLAQELELARGAVYAPHTATNDIHT